MTKPYRYWSVLGEVTHNVSVTIRARTASEAQAIFEMGYWHKGYGDDDIIEVHTDTEAKSCKILAKPVKVVD